MARRIVLVVPSFPKGSETFIVSKLLGLLDRGWDAHVVCNRSEEESWAMFPQLAGRDDVRARVHVTWPHRPRWLAALLLPAALLRGLASAPARTLRYLARARRRLGLRAALRRLYLDAELVAVHPDLVHFEFGALAPGRMDLKELLDVRIVVSFRGYDLNFVGLDRPRHYAPVWQSADGLHFLGEDLWMRARKRGCPPDRFHVLIPPAIDTSVFEPRPRDRTAASKGDDPGRPIRVLSVGRLDWRKGYEDALLAVRRAVDRGVAVEYRIVGDGDYIGAVGFARHRLGLRDRVYLLGALDRDAVLAEMQEADVFLHAAVSEGFSNAVIEAQAMELPVLCTDAGGLAENVAQGETGLVVPRRDVTALAAGLERLSRDPALREQLGKAGRRRVLNRFRLEDQLESFDRFYRQVLDPGRASQAGERSGLPIPASELQADPATTGPR